MSPLVSSGPFMALSYPACHAVCMLPAFILHYKKYLIAKCNAKVNSILHLIVFFQCLVSRYRSVSQRVDIK